MKLIICADDFAQSPEIDSAIVRLIEDNRLTATSCMVNSPYWASSAKLLTAEIQQKADIGLHLDFTQFGYRFPHPLLILLSLLRCLPKLEIQQSIEHQLNQFEAALGKQPDFVDGHQHVHQLPQIRQILLSVLKRRYHKQLPWIRIARPHVASGIKGLIIKMLGANALENEALQKGFKSSSVLLGVYNFSGDAADYNKHLIAWAAQAKGAVGTSVLMCHPAVDDPHMPQLPESIGAKQISDPIYLARLNEFSVLNSESFHATFNGLEIVRAP
ncbi:MAG: ChbG/HpnK family deacetylase [Methylophilus sp.]